MTSIGENPFSSCSSLSAISVASGNTKYDSRNDCNAIIEKASKQLISGCSNTIIPAGVTSIGKNAFVNQTSLTSITIPEGVTTIGEQAFCGCSSLSSVSLPSSLTSIAGFGECSSLVAICIPENVASIEAQTFYECKNLTDVILPENVKNIGEYAFNTCKSLKYINIPKSVSSIGDYAFHHCDSMKVVYNASSLSLSKTDKAFSSNLLGGYTFPGTIINKPGASLEGDFLIYYASKVKEIVRYMGRDADVIVPEDATHIGQYAFYNCRPIQSINIPSEITEIRANAFKGCNNISTIIVQSPNAPTCKDQLTDIDTDECTLYIPSGSIDSYKAADPWKKFLKMKEINETYSTTLAAEYGTWIVPVDADIPEGLTIYSCDSYDGVSLELVEASSIEANKPYIVQGTPGATYTVTGTFKISATLSKGLLTGVYSSTEITSGYVLQDGAEGVGFYRVGSHAITLSPNRCYLNLPAGSAPMFRIGGTTQIVNVEEAQDDIVYDLFGRRVTDMNARGVFIRNGKKIYVK